MRLPPFLPAIAVFVMSALMLVTGATGCGPSKRDSGNAIVSKIEGFRRGNGRLPNSLSEIGLAEDESGPYYYCKSDNNGYIVWYGKTLGKSDTYDSQTKKWSETGQGVCSH
jgi:hypothetical protein